MNGNQMTVSEAAKESRTLTAYIYGLLASGRIQGERLKVGGLSADRISSAGTLGIGL